jgi:hypothetical protein
MATAKTLSLKDRAMLKAFGKAGDLMARAALNAIDNDANLGRAALVAGGTNVAAKGATAVHAAIRGDTAITPVTTGITNPAVPRNIQIAFGATWDGGDVVVVGTDANGAAVTETFVSDPGQTVVGTKIFKTVTSVAHTELGVDADAGNTYSTGTGDKLGLVASPAPAAGSPVLLFTNGVAEAVTFDSTLNAFTPASVPNGSRSYVLSFNQ